ncbi:hypothetical protein B0H12DRAFT_1085927 [Mycena haematopus]|nr:hypothetical protein B0H12DRAFT_1085927 [Mycena haematopus]
MSPNWIALTKELEPYCLLATTMSTASLRDRRSLRHSTSSSDHKLTFSGFLPMPPISASPVCTPTSTHREILSTGTPSELSELDLVDRDHLLTHVPTWIATPPTPRVRRAVTYHSASFLAADSRAGRDSPSRSDDSRIDRVTSPESDLGSEPSDARGVEKAKDDVRKYHALMELLSTEVSYLADLRALFSIYLRHLPTLCRSPSTTFGRGSSSRNSSYTHLPKTSVLSDQGLHPLTTLHTKSKPMARPIFTNSEVDLLTRNAEEVLQLHENFVEELRAVVFPLGFPMELSLVGQSDEEELIRNIDAAVGKVSTKFVAEAFRFDAYQSFCTGHTEALQLVRRAQHQYPLEWEAYEQQCASLIANMGGDGPDNRTEFVFSPESIRSSSSDSEERQQQTNKLRKRTSSLTSLDGAVRRVQSRANSKEGSLDGGKDKHSRRLAFLDYMIKPIQRICKYPLLLDQLRPGKALRSITHPAAHPHVHHPVESAAQAMRHVARAVDEARHREDVKMQSSLIISRIALANPASATSYMSTASAPYPTVQKLMPNFMSSLGTCLLAGSLDVMHYQSSNPSSHGTNINAKYLGAFLYLGGYLILVKVTKGKVYEPRHWFPLADFSVVDLVDEDTSLPCTFSLTCKGHQFDLTAACQREKDAWLSSIHESRLHPPAWINEPTASIHCDGKGDLVPSTLDGPFEMIHALPTIQSLPEIAKDDGDLGLTESVLASLTQSQAPKAEVPSKSEPTHSRRSSSASVKAIFGPSTDSDTIVIRRSSQTARSQVDQGLQDIISEPILAARSYASKREELFQAPRILRASGSIGRSSSALSLTGLTKNRLSRHESVRVPRRKSFAGDGILASPKKSLRGCQKRRPKRLSIVSTSEAESIFQLPSDLSASPFSQCSSNFTSPIESPPVLDGHAAQSHPPPAATHSVPSLTPSPLPSAPFNPYGQYRTLTNGLLKRWNKGSRHRRTHSAPHDQNVPEGAASDDILVGNQSPNEFGAALSLVASPESDTAGLHPPSPPAELARRMRLLSSDAPITFRHSSADNTLPRSNSKKGSIFRRLKGLTPIATP